MATYLYPVSADMRMVEQDKLPQLTQDDPLFQILPIREVKSDVIMWTQKDNYLGLQQLRGLNGEPPRINRTGAKEYVEVPGVYGEYAVIDEKELTQRGALVRFGEPVDIEDLVMDAQDELLARRLDRIRQIGWTLLSTGTFSVADLKGTVGHTGSYTLQTYAASAWGTPGSGTPLADFRGAALLGRGKSVSFGRKARAFMNQITFNKIINVTNAADLGGQRINNSTVQNLSQVNEILLAQDLPQIELYDEGYLNDAGTFVPFLANNKTVIVGARKSGAPLGFYAMTRNASNEGAAPGPYTYVKVADEPPVSIKVHDGHNGGPALEFPGSIIVMTNT